MKINLDDYKWKMVGVHKKNSTEENLTIFSEISGYIIERIMEELAIYQSDFSTALINSEEYKKAKAEINKKMKRLQRQNLISITAISRLTQISENRILEFDNEDFNTGELFVLSAVLDKLLM